MLSQFSTSSSCHTTVTGHTHPHSVQPLQVFLPVFNNLVTCKNTLVFLRLGLLIVHHHLHTQLLPLQLRTQHKLSILMIITLPTKNPLPLPISPLMSKQIRSINKMTVAKHIILWLSECLSGSVCGSSLGFCTMQQ